MTCWPGALAGLGMLCGGCGGDTGDGGSPGNLPNLIDWARVAGVEGGIPARTTTCADLSSLDSTGTTDVLPALQAALDACPDGHVVMLPGGTFRIDGQLRMRSHVTLRGAGPTTILRPSQPILFSDGLGRKNVDAVSGLAKGSTRLTLAEAPVGLTVGSSFMLNELDDPSYVHPYGYEDPATLPLLCTYCDEPDNGTRTRGQMARVTAIDGVDVDFTPALYSGFAAERAPRINYPTAGGDVNMLVYAGIEHVTLDPSGGTMTVQFNQAQNCWLDHVRFEIRDDAKPAVYGYFAHRINIQHSTFNGHAPLAQAILSQVHTEGWLVENNLFVATVLTFLNVGRQGGHVFAYNFVASNAGTSTALINDNGNHGAHPQYLLYEGNKLAKHHADSIHGSSSHYTLFRNHIRCRRDETTFGAGCVWIDSWNYYYNVVGNVLGYEGMPDWQYEIESPTPIDQTLYIFRFGYSGYHAYMAYPLSKSTTLRHGNYDFGRHQVDWDPSIDTQDLPASLYLSAKPAWFGSLDWPAIGPDVDGYHTKLIPAEYRYLHGGADP